MIKINYTALKKPIILIGFITFCLLIIIAILSLSGVFSRNTPSESTTSNRGITIQPVKSDEAESYFKQGNTYLNSREPIPWVESINKGGYRLKMVLDLETPTELQSLKTKLKEIAQRHRKEEPMVINPKAPEGITNTTSSVFEVYFREGGTLWEEILRSPEGLNLSKDYKKAIESFKQAIRIKPNYADAHCNLGVAYKMSGDYQKAMESYKEAIRIKSDYVDAHYNLGVAYFHNGDRGSALDEYNVLKGLDKELANKLFNLIYGK